MAQKLILLLTPLVMMKNFLNPRKREGVRPNLLSSNQWNCLQRLFYLQQYQSRIRYNHYHHYYHHHIYRHRSFQVQ